MSRLVARLASCVFVLLSACASDVRVRNDVGVALQSVVIADGAEGVEYGGLAVGATSEYRSLGDVTTRPRVRVVLADGRVLKSASFLAPAGTAAGSGLGRGRFTFVLAQPSGRNEGQLLNLTVVQD